MRIHVASGSCLGFLVLASSVTAQGAPSPARESRVADARDTVRVVLEGFVVEPDGAPAVGAAVSSSAGGAAVADRNGRYRLETQVPRDARSVQVTATGSGNSYLTASATVELSASSGSARVEPLALVPGNTCPPRWLPTFGAEPGTSGPVFALAVHDDGTGPALYAGGSIATAGGVPANGVAKWDGTGWSALGLGTIGGSVSAIAVYDDGSGPALYAAGAFQSASGPRRIAKWDGTSWGPLGDGLGASFTTSVSAKALAVHDDGSGQALYAGGDFTTASGVVVNRIARWDGASWSALGSGMSASVEALAVYDDGSGPALYAGGRFTTAGGVTANHVARWDGTSWSALGSGMGEWIVYSLAVHDDGGGPALYVGGDFTTAGGVTANHVARWDGASWSALGSGMDESVLALSVHDDGGGPALYAGGVFTAAGGVTANHVAKWNGTSWSALGSGTNDNVRALTVFDRGRGPELYAGGPFTLAGSITALHVARWNGSDWVAFDDGLTNAYHPSVSAVAALDDGSGPALYAGGDFTIAGSVTVNRIGRWNGSSWSALGGGVSGIPQPRVSALAAFDDGGGLALHAGGTFTTAGGVTANGIAKWDGSGWTALGTGMSGETDVRALAVFDDGSGAALYAGGRFTTAGGVTANGIAKWDGASWSALGGGMGGGTAWVLALAVFDDGSGPALYAGGSFTTAGGVAANRIAKWDGATWSALGSGVNAFVGSLAVYDDGSGPALYAGGSLTTAGGVPANRIARWNGTSWSALGSGMGNSLPDVLALAVHDDGSGAALYAGGAFTTAGGMAANRIAKWDGSSWAALGSGVNSSVYALTVYDDGNGPALIAGGWFSLALDSGDSYLARWGCPLVATGEKVRAR